MTELLKPQLSLNRIEGEPPLPTPKELSNIAEVYANAFAGEPWNEYTKCIEEGKYFGNTTQPGDLCTCGSTLLEAYPQQETEAYITGELARPDASLFLLRDDTNDMIAGFTWGFSYANPEEFAAEKYQTEAMRERVVRVLGQQGINETFYYLSESAILNDPNYRGRGLSRQLHQARLRVAAEKSLPAVQRTNAEGPMYRTSLKADMTQIMGPEVTVDTAARTFTRTGVIINDVTDSEIEPRVLFVK